MFHYNKNCITKYVIQKSDVYKLFDILLSKYNIDNMIYILSKLNSRILSKTSNILGIHTKYNLYYEFTMKNTKMCHIYNIYNHLCDYCG